MICIAEGASGKTRTVWDDSNPRISWDEYKCAECGGWVHSDDVVWVDPDTGEATTGDTGKPYHDHCTPEEQCS